MKKYFYIFIFLSAPAVNAQNSVSGKITDKETKEALPLASVYFPDLRRGTTSDKDGIYKIDKLPAGKFLVEVKYIGYASLALKVEISGETKINFELEQAVTEFSEVVVTGVSAATARNENPVSSSVVAKKKMAENASSSIIDAIAREPGVSQVSTGTGISKPVIRGLGLNRVLVLQNGIRQEGQQWGDEHGVEIDEYSVDRVEIIKGPGSLMYGSDAMAGVINFLSPHPPDEGKITGNFFSNYQSNNNLLGLSGMGAGNINGIHWLVRASGKKAGNYSNAYDGKVFNSGFDEFNANASAGIIRQWGYSNFHFSRFSQQVGLTEGARDSSGNFLKEVLVNDSTIEEQPVTNDDLRGYKLFEPKQNISHLRISSDHMFITGNSRFSFAAGFQQNHRKEFEVHEGQPGSEEEPALYFLLNTIHYDAKFFFPEKKGWEISLGAGGMYQVNRNKGDEFLIPEYGLYDLGGFVFTKKSFEKIHLAGGVRYDTRNIDSEELLLDTLGKPTTGDNPFHEKKFSRFNASFSNMSGSMGGSYTFKKGNVAKLNISRGFRAPNLPELASNGQHHGTNQYILGDNSLLPEVSLQLDAGVIFNTKHISFEMAGFHNAIDNFIFLHKLNSFSGGDSLIAGEGGDTLSVFKHAQGNARLYGGETVIDFHPHLPGKKGHSDWLHFENGFSLVLAEQLNQPDSTKYLPLIPAHRLRSELKADFEKAGKHLRHFYLKAEGEYYFKQDRFYSAYGTETATPAYFLLNAGMGFVFVSGTERELFALHISAANILDAAYQHHLSRLKYAGDNPATGRTGVYSMGRNISVKLIVPVEF